MKIRNLGTKIDWVTHNSITKNTCVLFSKTSWRPTMLACFSLKRWALVVVTLTAPSQGRRRCGSRKLRAALQHFYGLTCNGWVRHGTYRNTGSFMSLKKPVVQLIWHPAMWISTWRVRRWFALEGLWPLLSGGTITPKCQKTGDSGAPTFIIALGGNQVSGSIKILRFCDICFIYVLFLQSSIALKFPNILYVRIPLAFGEWLCL